MNKSKIQVLIEGTVGSMLSLLKVIILSKLGVRLAKKVNNECVILANGPSLNDAIEEGVKLFPGKDLICVNTFAETEPYQKLKPSYYVLISPELYRPNVEEFLKQKRKQLFTAIAENTTWALSLYIPIEAKKYKEWRSIISKNERISIYYFNTSPVEGLRSVNHFLFRQNLGMPRPHNVLIPSLFLSINMSYEKIYLLGVDHSWLKDIWVTEDNRVLLTQKHFYDADRAKPLPMNKGGRGERKLHEVLQKFLYAFRGYFILNGYAKSKEVQILNLTEGSYIDAFERASINKTGN